MTVSVPAARRNRPSCPRGLRCGRRTTVDRGRLPRLKRHVGERWVKKSSSGLLSHTAKPLGEPPVNVLDATGVVDGGLKVQWSWEDGMSGWRLPWLLTSKDSHVVNIHRAASRARPVLQKPITLRVSRCQPEGGRGSGPDQQQPQKATASPGSQTQHASLGVFYELVC